MNRLCLSVLLIVIMSSSALATVRPPAEWFESEANRQKWQEIFPKLNEMEFGISEPLVGPGVSTSEDFRKLLGRRVSELGAAEANSGRLDLNLDGVIDHFDLLELGYEVPRVTKSTSIAPSEGVAEWCVLRADFSTQAADYDTYTTGYFEDKFFNTGVTPPSANDYFQEVSYGKLSIQGSVASGGSGGDGWYRAANSKEFYDASSNNARNLIFEMVMASDPEIDYSDFDTDGDGYVDTLIVFYAGPVWFGGGLHPHRWSGVNAHVDGVIVDSYFLTGYDSNDSYSMTITCHEYGHILGLPDLYDTDYSSNGMARWSLMADNYDNDQLIPSPDPWCKMQLGWVTPTVITENVDDYPLNAYETHPEVLKVWTNGQQEDQYFLIANIQRILTDQTRPGDGLLVLHCDDSRTNNTNEYRKWVDVESARGLDNPASNNPRDPIDDGNSGHPNDLWFAGNSDGDFTGEFSSGSNPTSNNYPAPGNGTSVRLSDFSASAAVMTLDIEVKTADAPAVDITSHSNNDNVSGMINVTATATPAGGRTINRVEFYLNGAYFGSDSSAPYSLDINTKPVYNGSRVLKVIAVDSASEISTDSVNVNVSNTADSFPWVDGFESGIGNWASYNLGGAYRWELKNTGSSGSSSAGVGSEGDGYQRNEHDLLVSPLIDLTSSVAPLIRWFQRYRVSTGENTCKMMITTNEGASFDTLASFTGTNTGWHIAGVNLAGYAGQQVRLAFRLDSSSLNNIGSGIGGYWVDEIELKELSAPPNIISITPGDGATLSGLETITITATDDEGIASVNFILDGNSLGSDTSSPYTTDWNSDWIFDTSLPFTAEVIDLDGQLISQTIGWTTSNPGLPIPWNEGWEGTIEPSYRIIDVNGRGFWHTRPGQGYGGTTAMFFGRNTQSYGSNQSDTLISPTILISGLAHPGLGMVHHYDIEDGFDFAQVYVTTDLNTWSQIASFTGDNQLAWRAGGASLDPWQGDKIKLGWYFFSDGGVNGDGYWLDEVALRESPRIDAVSPATLHDGDSFTVTGEFFGEALPVEFGSVTIGGLNAVIIDWTTTSIQGTVTPGSISGDLIVLSRGIPSNGFPVKVLLEAPALLELGEIIP
jgi:immune inhibitor A